MESVVRVTFASILALAIGGASRVAAAQSQDSLAPEPVPSLAQPPVAAVQPAAPDAAPAPPSATEAPYSPYPPPLSSPYQAPDQATGATAPPAVSEAAPAPVGQAPTAPGPEYQAAMAAPLPAPHMPREVIEAASAYVGFIDHAAAIDAHFADGGAVTTAMATAESYQADQLAEGSVAYAALIALQDARFVSGVRQAAATPEVADALIRGLEADPTKAAAIMGADGAALRINAVLGYQAEQVAESGRKLRQASYDMQRDDWSRQMTPDAPARLAQAKALSSTAATPSADDIAKLFQLAAALRDQTVSAPGAIPGYTPVVQRGLTLAAMALVGRASREEIEATGLTKVRDSADCMQSAKLNLYQCLAVAGPHYEDVFCIGEHALKETGQCLRQGAGAPIAQPVNAQTAASQAPAAPDTYAVPVAVAAGTGGR